MKKSARTAALFLLCMVLLMPAFLLFVLPGLHQAVPSLQQEYKEELNNHLAAIAASMALDLDENYDFLQFKDDVSKELQEEVRQDFRAVTAGYEGMAFDSDYDLSFLASYNNESLESRWEKSSGRALVEKGEALYWYELRADKNGRLVYTSSALEEGTTYPVDLDDMMQYAWYNDGDGAKTFSQLASISLPAGYTCALVIGDQVAPGNLFYNAFYTNNGTIPAFLLVSGILFLILLVIILLLPGRLEEEMPVFGHAMRWPLLGLLACGILFAGMYELSLQLVLWYDQRILVNILQSWQLHPANAIAFGLQYLTWTAAFASFVCAGLGIKEILCLGFVHYWKERTGLYRIYAWCKAKLQVLESISLDGTMRPFYVRLGLVVFSATFLICLLGGVGLSPSEGHIVWWLLLSLAAVLFAIWICHKSLEKSRQDFQATMQAASYLAQGEFQKVKPASTGCFQPLYDTLLQIRAGFEKAVKEAIASQNMKTELMANVSHDLKTPITGIQSYAQLLEQAQNPEEMHAYAAKINEYCDRLDRMVVDLFDVSKANSGNIELHAACIDLHGLLEQIVSENQESLDARGLQVVWNVPKSPVEVCLDPDRTARMFDNLVANIAKYALDNTRVFIEMTCLPGQVMVTLKNISRFPIAFDEGKIIERFQRGDAARSEAGSGLGLAIVSSFAAIQNAQFRIACDGDLFKAILVFPLSSACGEENGQKTEHPSL